MVCRDVINNVSLGLGKSEPLKFYGTKWNKALVRFPCNVMRRSTATSLHPLPPLVQNKPKRKQHQ